MAWSGAVLGAKWFLQKAHSQKAESIHRKTHTYIFLLGALASSGGWGTFLVAFPVPAGLAFACARERHDSVLKLISNFFSQMASSVHPVRSQPQK